MLKPVVWEEGRYSIWHAKVGRYRVATVHYSTTREDPLPWILELELFGARYRRGFKEQAAAKAALVPTLTKMVGELLAKETA